MKIKQIPQDFIVEEIFDLESLKNKESEEKRKQPYYYFKLTKINYNQIRALEIVARIFNTSRKLVHFAGTKDKVGITSQLISVYGINEKAFEKNLEFFNSKFEDLNLEFLGLFERRVNLGDNLGNRFKVIVRDLGSEDIEKAQGKLDRISKIGVLNFFDEQRFGYANNSHIVGKLILKNKVETAVFEILTSLPPNPSEDMKKFVDSIKDNWEGIKNQDIEKIDFCISLSPKFLKNEVLILEHLKKFKNDFPGAFRKIHKKIRTLYINAYQSYLFNETVKRLEIGEQRLEAKKESLVSNHSSLIPLVSSEVKLDGEIKSITEELMKEDEIKYEDFNLPSMPELRVFSDLREVRVFPTNIKIGKIQDDDLNIGRKKVVVEFELGKGEYATNVVKQLFL